jgi:ubiquinone/menaquinone biosynthesis C-methylase UbiE
MSEERWTLEQIRDYWSRQAREHGASPSASWSDFRVIEMEIRELASRLADGDQVLDVGCANGFSTVQLASQTRVRIRGVDYVPEMIEQAKARLAGLRGRLAGDVEFGVDDITRLSAADASYDKVVVVRVVINLGDWHRQLAAMRECARVLRPGGTLLLSEATLQGWRRMNALRTEWGLPEIGMPAFNTYLDEDAVVEALAPELELVEIANFASTYFVMTRIVKPLLAKATGAPVAVADPAAEFNRWASLLPACGDYGTQKLFVFRRR